MQKSDLQIEPYTLNEALICLNKELKKVSRKEIKLKTFYNLIYSKKKDGSYKIVVTLINKPKHPVLIEYNSIVDVYCYITTKRYPKNRKRHVD